MSAGAALERVTPEGVATGGGGNRVRSTAVEGSCAGTFEEAVAEAANALVSADASLLAKLREVSVEVPGVSAGWLIEPLLQCTRSAEQQRDQLATRLMEVFRIHQSRAAFGLLYELFGPHLLGMVAARLRRYQSKADPGDVLQEVFVNIYRYPHRFDASKDDAFRLWSSTIVRNTVLKHLRSLSRNGRLEVGFEDLPEPTEPRNDGPLQGVLRDEACRECTRVYLPYLHLYLQFYMRLSEREQRAIHLVEVDECSYREAAAQLGIKLENLKMVIFRARRKIHRSMRRVFDGLPPDVRPARTPRAKVGGGTKSDPYTKTPVHEDARTRRPFATKAEAWVESEQRSSRVGNTQ